MRRKSSRDSLTTPLMSEEVEEYQTFEGGSEVDHEVKRSLGNRICQFVSSNRFMMYVCCFITSWGDRMWSFAIGVYMIALYPTSLELTAIFGFLNSAGSLIFGAIIGDLIDKTQRLKAVRFALVIRNFSIFTCSAAVFFVFTYLEEINDSWLSTFSKAGIIFLAVLAHLASIANNITVTKDWVVVVCADDKESLMEMSAVFRRIDLACKILSPIVVGQIMSFATNAISAVFICCENIVTLIIMYCILRTVYRRVPRLAVKTEEEMRSSSSDNEEDGEENHQESRKRKKEVPKWTRRLCSSCFSLYKGWKCYSRQPVCLAGLSLAMMFMTVLGFDNITVGYAYSQGLTPSVLSWIMAGSAVTGIIGTVMFLPMRARFGLMKTGVVAFCIDLLFLQLCVWAVFAPGTVFMKPPAVNTTSMPIVTNYSLANDDEFVFVSDASNSTNSTSGSTGVSVNASIILLMSGIVLSRIGLWLVDLTVTQLILETVAEKERGKVNGVQYAVSMFMDLLKFALVIFIPQPEYFGYLILLSFLFMIIGLIIFTVYAYRNNFVDVNRVSVSEKRERERMKKEGARKKEVAEVDA